MEAAQTRYKVVEDHDNIILQPLAIHKYTLIWLHGFGDSPKGYLNFFCKEEMVPPNTKVVLLAAPQRYVAAVGASYTAWYDFKMTSPGIEEANLPQLHMMSQRISKVISREAHELSDDFSKIFVGGFSQGSVMALYAGLGQSKEIGGVCALSGYLHGSIDPVPAGLDKIRVLVYHGQGDRRINYVMAAKSYERIKAAVKNVEVISEPDMEHEISGHEVPIIRAFFAKCMP